MKFIALIPARYGSSRFEGKPLVKILGTPMIERVYKRVSDIYDFVAVATDDSRIEDCVKKFGGNVIMTSQSHKSGTDRVAEAHLKAEKLFNTEFDVVVNVQGDEPFVSLEQLNSIKECFKNKDTQIATLVKPFAAEDDIFNENTPKVVLSKDSHAIYFSRSVIPFLRNSEKQNWSKNHQYFKHIGLYAYKSEVLHQITKLEMGVLEQAESLEQLRWLENGYKVKVAITNSETHAIDTPEDLILVEKLYKDKL
ncbi:MAG: 3-deoxy-manno-octulosonate cytidylyltransferase [Rikenellaceae bacterium]